MKKKVEADIDILSHQSVDRATDEFKENFCKFIIKHYLRKFHFLFYFFFALDKSDYFSSPKFSTPRAGTNEWKKGYLAAKLDAKNP